LFRHPDCQIDYTAAVAAAAAAMHGVTLLVTIIIMTMTMMMQYTMRERQQAYRGRWDDCRYDTNDDIPIGVDHVTNHVDREKSW
jgi:hypothetical protein